MVFQTIKLFNFISTLQLFNSLVTRVLRQRWYTIDGTVENFL